jgi:integrase
MASLLNPKEQALLRGWMNGLGWPLLGKLYLDGADMVATRQAVAALRQRLSVRARQCGLGQWEAFWQKERGTGEAWMAEAQAGLATLLESPEPTPNADDSVARWFAAPVAKKLEAANLATLAAVAAARQNQGRFWWRELPSFGSHSAQIIERFLKSHAAVFPATGNALQTLPTASPASNPTVDGLFDQRPDLSGENGSNRADTPRCRIPAANDFQAIHAWLDLREAEGHTFRLYRKEAERFLLWAVSERGKPLSSLDTVDCKAYRDFLFAPSPEWSNPQFEPRWSLHWRPFKSPLSRRNVKLAETVLSSMCGWLVKQRYLDSNPFDGLPPLNAHELQSVQVEHALSEGQWQWLMEYCARCETQPPQGRLSRDYRRLWIALQLAYCTGLRLSELAAARFGDIVHKRRHGGQYWLGVLGKGRKPREVPLPNDLVLALRGYAQERGVPWGVPDSPEPIIGKFRKTAEESAAGIDFIETTFSACGLHRVLRGFFLEAAAARLASASTEEERHDAAVLGQMTVHWLRHTHASHALQRGAALLHVKENLGHASLATTSVYLHADKDERHKIMGELFQKRGNLY